MVGQLIRLQKVVEREVVSKLSCDSSLNQFGEVSKIRDWTVVVEYLRIKAGLL